MKRDLNLARKKVERETMGERLISGLTFKTLGKDTFFDIKGED